jgi:hypothetical protein
METRRTFLTGLVVLGASSAMAPVPTSSNAQNPTIPPPPTQHPGIPGQQGQDPDVPTLPNPDKRILENNDKDVKKKVEQLYKLASELKEQVENTDSSKVLSVNLLKKAEEIEKLAHDIRTRAKG